MTVINKEIAAAATTLRNEVRTQVWAALVGEKRALSQLKLHVTVGKEVYRFKDVQDLIERAQAVHKANARTLSGTGVNVFDEVLGAKVVLQRGAKTEDVALALVRGKLSEVITEGAVPTKVVRKQKAEATDTVKPVRKTKEQRVADSVADNKIIADVAKGKGAKAPAATDKPARGRGTPKSEASTKPVKKAATKKAAPKA